jgi:primosomal replication protein N
MNRLLLTTRLVERGGLRYTPAGLPALDLRLAHESEVSEDGSPRKVRFELRAVAIGEVTAALSGLSLGQVCRMAGFLAGGGNGRGLKFHVTEVEPD